LLNHTQFGMVLLYDQVPLKNPHLVPLLLLAVLEQVLDMILNPLVLIILKAEILFVLQKLFEYL